MFGGTGNRRVIGYVNKVVTERNFFCRITSVKVSEIKLFFLLTILVHDDGDATLRTGNDGDFLPTKIFRFTVIFFPVIV